ELIVLCSIIENKWKKNTYFLFARHIHITQKHIYSFSTLKTVFNLNSCLFNPRNFFFHPGCWGSLWRWIDINKSLNNWWTFSSLNCFCFSNLFQFIFCWINTKTIFKYIHDDEE